MENPSMGLERTRYHIATDTPLSRVESRLKFASGRYTFRGKSTDKTTANGRSSRHIRRYIRYRFQSI